MLTRPQATRVGLNGMDYTIAAADYFAISDLKARYFEYVDSKNWVRLRGLFTNDATFAGFAFSADGGPEGFISALASFLTGAVSHHRGFMPRLRAVDTTVVRGSWTMQDYVTWPSGSRIYKGFEAPGFHGISGYGRYEDEYTRTTDGWRISFCRIARTRIDPLVGPPVDSFDFDFISPDAGWLQE